MDPLKGKDRDYTKGFSTFLLRQQNIFSYESFSRFPSIQRTGKLLHFWGMSWGGAGGGSLSCHCVAQCPAGEGPEAAPGTLVPLGVWGRVMTNGLILIF